MSEPRWEEEKHHRNILRHGIDFMEATSALDDPAHVTWHDVGHSINEERHLTVGISRRGRFLLVVTSFDESGTTRIISARRATKRERHAYETGWPPD